MYINKLRVHGSSAERGRFIDIEALGIEFKLSLLQVSISSGRMPLPAMSLNKPIKLISRKIEINNLSFSIDQHHSSNKERQAIISITQSSQYLNVTSQKIVLFIFLVIYEMFIRLRSDGFPV